MVLSLLSCCRKSLRVKQIDSGFSESIFYIAIEKYFYLHFLALQKTASEPELKKLKKKKSFCLVLFMFLS